MVTQQQLARAVGLSQTAVSMALRNSSAVSRATVRRVQAAARRLGYRPNPLISALMAQRLSGSSSRFRAKLAFLTPFPPHEAWRHSSYAAGCFAGAQAAARARGYLCEAIWTAEPGRSRDRLSQILWTQNVQGLIIEPLQVDQPPLTLDWSRFAAVSLDYSLADPELHRVVDDHAFGIERVLEEVGRLGYRRPGLVIRAVQDVRTHHSRLGVFLVQRRLHPEWTEVAPLVLPSDQWDTQRFVEWLRRERPDVILTEETQVPATVQAAGLRVPRDVGIAFFHKEEPVRHLSGLQVDSREVGATAASILMRLVEMNDRGPPAVPTTTLVKAFTWNPGTTLCRRPAAGARRTNFP